MDYETTNSSLFGMVTQVSTGHMCATFLSQLLRSSSDTPACS